MRPFEVSWGPEEIAALKAQIRAYRFPETRESAGWAWGCDPAFLKDICAWWADGFDMGAAVRNLNRFPQVMATVEGRDIHAVHLVGEAGGNRPLLLSHGWPGSHFEFWDVADQLAFPSRFGGDAADAFDLVIPSLPGFGFSAKPEPPISAKSTARLFDQLMGQLGYDRYRAQGGDWGGGITGWLALNHAEHVQAIHLNLVILQPNAKPDTAEEIAWQAGARAVHAELGAYLALQIARPRSLAYAMENNPVAQAAWIIERFHDWSDRRERRFEDIFSRDELLTNVMIYVMNRAFVSAAYYYAASAQEDVRRMPKGARVEVPTAVAAFPDPRSPPPPRSWVEKGYNLIRRTEPAAGGHFAAMEAPDAFVDDLKTWGRLTD